MRRHLMVVLSVTTAGFDGVSGTWKIDVGYNTGLFGVYRGSTTPSPTRTSPDGAQ